MPGPKGSPRAGGLGSGRALRLRVRLAAGRGGGLGLGVGLGLGLASALGGPVWDLAVACAWPRPGRRPLRAWPRVWARPRGRLGVDLGTAVASGLSAVSGSPLGVLWAAALAAFPSASGRAGENFRWVGSSVGLALGLGQDLVSGLAGAFGARRPASGHRAWFCLRGRVGHGGGLCRGLRVALGTPVRGRAWPAGGGRVGAGRLGVGAAALAASLVSTSARRVGRLFPGREVAPIRHVVRGRNAGQAEISARGSAGRMELAPAGALPALLRVRLGGRLRRTAGDGLACCRQEQVMVVPVTSGQRTARRHEEGCGSMRQRPSGPCRPRPDLGEVVRAAGDHGLAAGFRPGPNIGLCHVTCTAP